MGPQDLGFWNPGPLHCSVWLFCEVMVREQTWVHKTWVHGTLGSWSALWFWFCCFICDFEVTAHSGSFLPDGFLRPPRGAGTLIFWPMLFSFQPMSGLLSSLKARKIFLAFGSLVSGTVCVLSYDFNGEATFCVCSPCLVCCWFGKVHLVLNSEQDPSSSLAIIRSFKQKKNSHSSWDIWGTLGTM